MGLLNSRNLSKAKAMLDKNRHKIGGIVDKATDQIDKVSKGKSSNITKKVDDAAHKYSAGSGSGVSHSGLDDETFHDEPISATGPYDDAELQRRQAEAGIAATNAATAAAEAFTNLANKAASEIDAQQRSGDAPPPPPTDG